MTREEAKRILYVYRAVNLVDASHREAFDMAITELEQEPCTDAISRQAAINVAVDAVDDWDGGCNKTREEYIRKALETIPPVTAEKVGEWTTTITPLGKCCICSECGSCPPIEYRFCPYCGAKMQEVEE